MSMTHLHDNEIILDVKNLRVAYGKVEALHEVSLTIRRGDFTIGEGPWAAFDIVANDIQIKFRIAASGK